MKSLIKKASNPGDHSPSASLGLLILRIFPGAFMLFAHGWPKLTGFSEKSGGFPDPFGIGSPASLGLAVFAEVFCAIAVMLGLFTRAAALPLLVTMIVAAFMIHADDPFQKKELALMYAVPFLILILTGAGRFSLDGRFKK